MLIDQASASFLEDAAQGTLPQVSWIDPNFTALGLYGGDSNDDHPPADVSHGQDLALLVYHALASSPLWNKTMLVITYDEHGGFYDHVPPPPALDDNPATFGRYGVRVPALIVSPYVEPRSLAKDARGESILFDHTSLIKTILLRFCAEALTDHGSGGLFAWLHPGHPHYMGRRVAEANHLGAVLTGTSARPVPDRTALLTEAADRAAVRARAAVTNIVDPTRTHRPLSDLQIRVANAANRLRKAGLPPGQP